MKNLLRYKLWPFLVLQFWIISIVSGVFFCVEYGMAKRIEWREDTQAHEMQMQNSLYEWELTADLNNASYENDKLHHGWSHFETAWEQFLSLLEDDEAPLQRLRREP